MNYLGAWAAIAAFSLIAAMIFGKKAGYGLLIATIAAVVLVGAEQFGIRFNPGRGGTAPVQ